MLDSLLLVEGETERSFQFTLEFDRSVPTQAAMEACCPPVEHATQGRRPKTADSGWILGLSARNVAVVASRVDRSEEADETSVILLMNECEGRSTRCRIRCARSAKSAVVQSFDGTVLEELTVEADGTDVPFSGFQVRQIRLTF